MGGERPVDIAAASTEFLHVNVTATIPGPTPVAPPQFAFVSGPGNPEPESWLPGEWQGPWARLLLGPNGGAVTLDPGRYAVWVSFAVGAETPVRRAGTLTVY